MPEISEHDLQVLRGSAQLLDDLWNDPKHGMAVKRAIKDKRPSVSIPEVDVPDTVLAPVHGKLGEIDATMAKINERLAAMDAEKADAKLEDKFRGQLGKAREKFRLTADGEKGVLELMQERQIADPEAAAALYVANQPKPKASSLRDTSAYGGSSYSNLFGMRGDGDADAALLARDPDAFFDQKVTEVLNEYAEQA